MSYGFHPEALGEYHEAAHYYARPQPDLDLRCIACLEEAIALIVEAPDRWRPVDEEVRRCLTPVFRYRIPYTIEPGFVLIVAVAPYSRAPRYWKHRIV